MFFTFGYGHECVCGRVLRNCYTVLEAEGAESARQRMFRIWGRRWSFEYDTLEQATGGYNAKYVATVDAPDLCPCGNPKPPVEVAPAVASLGMLWFGPKWDAAICVASNAISPPIDENCFCCQQPIEAGQRGFVLRHPAGQYLPWHLNCFLQSLGISEKGWL